MSDTPARERWFEIDALFQEALDLDPAERAAFVERRCAGDEELRDAVQELLASDLGAGSFLEASAGSLLPEEVSAALEGEAPDGGTDRVGERVGAFRIVRQVGRGGMAGVFEAERADGHFEQRVAIKFLRRGLDTEDFVRRFLAERRILSSLEHPNIARLVDGGTTDEGLPYLALELVDGVPITEYCTEARSSVEGRLRLFVQVARAVQHAHSNLVVHRDIKPSNILVRRDGEVKLLDFGIAKLLDPGEAEAAPLTRTGLRPLTPEYASPEQVRGDAITTASDVYQLGVLLYQLLTGERPHGSTGTGPTLADAVTTEQPRAPSEAVKHPVPGRDDVDPSPARLSRRLRGDLDTIVLKALRKDPARRYGTALEMADDVERHLDGRAIAARRESTLYRTGKFLRRNPWVAPVSAAALVLTTAYVATLVRHRDQLEEERNVARDVQQSFVSFFTAPDPGDTGLGEGRRDLTILQAIEDGTDRVRADLADRPAALSELFVAMARVLQDLDEPERAHALASEALDLARGVRGEDAPQVHEVLLLAGELTPDPDSARVLLERRLELSHALYGPDDVATAASLQALAGLERRVGDMEAAVALMEEAIAIYRAAESTTPRMFADALADLAGNLSPLDREEEAVAPATEAYEILRRELGERHSQTANAGAYLAQILTAAGRYDEARSIFETSLEALDSELGATHQTTVSARNDYAIALRLLGDPAAAEAVYRTLLDANQRRFGEAHVEIATSLQNLAVTVEDQGRLEEAEGLSLAAFQMFEETRGRTFFTTAFPLLTVAEIRLQLEDYPGAEAAAREALEILTTSLPPGHFASSVARCRVGQALAGQGRSGAARAFLEEGANALLAGGRAEVDAYRDECVRALEGL